MGTNLRDGNIGRMGMIGVTLTPASVAANITAEQTFTVQGLALGDFVEVSRPSALPAGTTLDNARVSAANTLALQFGNHTIGALVPAAGVYRIVWMRPEVGDPAVLPGAVQV